MYRKKKKDKNTRADTKNPQANKMTRTGRTENESHGVIPNEHSISWNKKP